MKYLLVVYENICFAIGLFVVIFVLTSVINGSKVSLYRDGEQLYCFSVDFKHRCINSQNEESKYEKTSPGFNWLYLFNSLRG